MSMKPPLPLPKSADIAIVGGGMVGLSLALLLAKQAPQAKILLIEALSLDGFAADDVLPPSFDARSTALAESSRRLFDDLGLWPLLATGVCAIKTIHVSDRGHPGATRMVAAESGLDGLGYVVENRQLGRVLMAAVAEHDNLQIVSPARVERLVPVAGGMEVFVAGNSCRAALAVVADGANSSLLQQLGIHTQCQDYGQCAVIANLALAQPHEGIAYERFTDEGPMALLPLQDLTGEHRAALVWTLPPQRAAELLMAEETAFIDALHQRFGFRAGQFVHCGERSSYPLKLMVAQEQIRSHLAVVGNAAHFLHPVAGQGFNLALRDAAKLAEIVGWAMRADKNPGSLAVLERYLQAQQRDQRNTIGFSHNLPALFGNGATAGIAVRNLGLMVLDLVSPARKEFARFGAGLANPAVKFPK